MKFIHLSIAAMLFVAASTVAQVPSTLGYQARLTTNAGSPVSGARTIVFGLYSSAAGGTPLWTETQNLTLVNGELSVALGESTPIPNSLFDRPLFLGIKVDSDAEMTPRPKLNASPYSVRAKGVLARTFHVPAGGTDLENGTALKALVAGLGTASNISIQLDAGSYDLGTSGITLGSRISLIGAGRDITFVDSTDPLATLALGGTSAVIREMSVQNKGTGPAGNTEGAAGIRVLDGANASKLSRLTIRSDVAAATTGIRCALWIGTAGAVQLDSVQALARGGAAARGIYATAVPNSAFELTIHNSEGRGLSTATAPAVGAYLVAHQGIQIRDSSFLSFGLGFSNIGLHLQESSGNAWNARITASNAGASSAERIALLITRPLGWEFHSPIVRANSPVGTGALNVAVDLNGNSSSGFVSFHGGTLIVDGGTSLLAIRSTGVSVLLNGSDVGAFGHAGSTAVSALQLLAPESGTQQGGSEIRAAQIRAFHPIASDLGAAIIAVGSNFEIDGGIIRATDDGIELGISGNAANPENAAAVYNARIESGRFSIRKHQNWGIALRHVDLRRNMLAEPGGYLDCFANTLNTPGGQFLPTGCPVAP